MDGWMDGWMDGVVGWDCECEYEREGLEIPDSVSLYWIGLYGLDWIEDDVVI